MHDVIERSPLTISTDPLGTTLERVLLADGTRLVVKRIRPHGDWLMRATHDPGVRDALVWTSGLLAQVPSVIDHAVIGVEPDGDAWLIIMRDVGSMLIPAGANVSRAGSRRILGAVAALHAAFRGEQVAGLCTLTDRYSLFSPVLPESEQAGRSPVSSYVRRGWELFAELMPADVSDAVFAILAAPQLLADELNHHPTTLIHGDLNLGNVGFAADKVILLDWGQMTAIAPSAVEFAHYLIMRSYHARIDASADALIEDIRTSAPELFDARALHLSLLGALAMYGWLKAGKCIDEADEDRRAASADLNWWRDHARDALAVWSPI